MQLPIGQNRVRYGLQHMSHLVKAYLAAQVAYVWARYFDSPVTLIKDSIKLFAELVVEFDVRGIMEVFSDHIDQNDYLKGTFEFFMTTYSGLLGTLFLFEFDHTPQFDTFNFECYFKKKDIQMCIITLGNRLIVIVKPYKTFGNGFTLQAACTVTCTALNSIGYESLCLTGGRYLSSSSQPFMNYKPITFVLALFFDNRFCKMLRDTYDHHYFMDILNHSFENFGKVGDHNKRLHIVNLSMRYPHGIQYKALISHFDYVQRVFNTRNYTNLFKKFSLNLIGFTASNLTFHNVINNNINLPLNRGSSSEFIVIVIFTDVYLIYDQILNVFFSYFDTVVPPTEYMVKILDSLLDNIVKKNMSQRATELYFGEDIGMVPAYYMCPLVHKDMIEQFSNRFSIYFEYLHENFHVRREEPNMDPEPMVVT